VGAGCGGGDRVCQHQAGTWHDPALDVCGAAALREVALTSASLAKCVVCISFVLVLLGCVAPRPCLLGSRRVS
jgi:hypothetical protein